MCNKFVTFLYRIMDSVLSKYVSLPHDLLLTNTNSIFCENTFGKKVRARCRGIFEIRNTTDIETRRQFLYVGFLVTAFLIQRHVIYMYPPLKNVSIITIMQMTMLNMNRMKVKANQKQSRLILLTSMLGLIDVMMKNV